MKTVKVFISSTFKDMNAERDVLIKDVFPKLREWAEETLGVLVQEVDLRWGVTEEQAHRGQVLDLCLESIDECQPYFLCILGKRYGWIPAPTHIRKDVFETILAADSPLEDDEKQLIRIAYSSSLNEKVVSLHEDISSNKEYIQTCLRKAGIKTCDDKTNFENIKGLIQQVLEKAGLPDASTSATEQEIRHVLGEHQIPLVIRDLDKIEAFKQLPKPEKDIINDFYVRGGSEPDWYLQPGYSGEDMHKLASILDHIGLKRGFYSFFLFRKDVGEDYPDYIETAESQINKLASLKDFIREAWKADNLQKPVAVEEYTCSWRPEIRGGYPITDLDEFGRRVFFLLKSHMENNPELKLDETEDLDDLSKERKLHMRFIDSHTYRFKGREQLLRTLEQAIHESFGGKLASNGRPTHYIMVKGEPGSGKSAIMAMLYLKLLEDFSDTLILPWFVGASKRSASIINLLKDFCSIFAKQYNITGKIPGDPKELIDTFTGYLEKFGKKVIVLIDAVNQLRDGVQNGRVSWLPEKLPDSVCVVYSLVEDLRDKSGRFDIEADRSFLEAMRKRQTQPFEIQVGKLSDNERKDIIRSYLRQFNKQLLQEQETAIAEKDEAYNPLFLQVALEELRMVSRFEDLPDFLASGIRHTSEGMFGQMLARAERDMERLQDVSGGELFRRFMVFIAVGRHGMSEEDLRLLLGDWKNIVGNGNGELQHKIDAARIPDLVWEQLRRSVRAYLFMSGKDLSFFHRQLKQAVIAKYLDTKEKLLKAHSEIADLYLVIGFQKFTEANDIHALEELPYHLSMADRRKEVDELLSDITYLDMRVASGDVYSLIENYRFTQCDQGTSSTRYRDFIYKNAEALRNRYNLFFSLTYLEGFKEARFLAGKAEHGAGWKRPWIRTEPVTLQVTQEAASFAEAVNLNGVISFTKSCAVDLAVSGDRAFFVIKVGQIGMINTEKMLLLDEKITTRPLLPLAIFASDDAQYLAIAYVNGEADVKKLVYDDSGNYLYYLDLDVISYLLPETEAPVMYWERMFLWYQQGDDLIRADFNGDICIKNKINIPTDYCGELSGAAACGDKRIFTFRKKNVTAVVCIGSDEIATGTQRCSADVCCVCSTAELAVIAYADHTIGVYSAEDGFTLLRQSGRLGAQVNAMIFFDDRLLGITNLNAVFIWDFLHTDNSIFLTGDDGLYSNTVQPKKIVRQANGFIQCISRSNVFNLDIAGGDNRPRYSIQYISHAGTGGHEAVIRDSRVFYLVGSMDFSPLFLSDNEYMLRHFAKDGKGNIFGASYKKLGYIIRPKQRKVIEVEEFPYITYAAGCAFGGFWLSENGGNIHYVDENGRIRLIADMGEAVLTGASLKCWDNLLIQCSIRHNCGEKGTDAEPQLTFYKYGQAHSDIEFNEIGTRLFRKDEGILSDVAYDRAEKMFYLVMFLQDDENVFIRYGMAEDIVNKSEDLLRLPIKVEGEAKAVYCARDDCLYILNKAGIVFAVDMKSSGLLATLCASEPFTDLIEDPFEDCPAFLIKGGNDPYVMEQGTYYL